ncbi:MAG: serine hydrolase [Candidatus Planktophila sp.]|nr:serine hydrolase [Candidatus Planktophila sp.]
MLKFIRRTLILILVIYVALFGLTKAIRYPEPIAAIKLGLAPASKTPDLMPAHTIKASDIPANWSAGSEAMPETVEFEGAQVTFDEFLESTHTNAFLVIRDGVLTYEKYLNGMNAQTRLPSYSVAKTMTSLMIGKLIDEGLIRESDTFVSVLPQFKAGTSFDKVTIRDLLDMKAGVGVSDNYPTGPSGWGVAIAQMYASTDVDWFLMHNRMMKEEPGTFAEYRSVDTMMLGMIIKKVTGRSLVDYFSENIWQKVGAIEIATWNVDRIGGTEKAFCCFNATARDYALVGVELIKPTSSIINSTWLHRISTPVVTLDYGWGYGAQVWHPYPGINLMLGLHGQFVWMDLANKTVIVKLSDEPTSSDGRSERVAPVLKLISEQN